MALGPRSVAITSFTFTPSSRNLHNHYAIGAGAERNGQRRVSSCDSLRRFGFLLVAGAHPRWDAGLVKPEAEELAELLPGLQFQGRHQCSKAEALAAQAAYQMRQRPPDVFLAILVFERDKKQGSLAVAEDALLEGVRRFEAQQRLISRLLARFIEPAQQQGDPGSPRRFAATCLRGDQGGIFDQALTQRRLDASPRHNGLTEPSIGQFVLGQIEERFARDAQRKRLPIQQRARRNGDARSKIG